jgi:FkbM family methyltransferase
MPLVKKYNSRRELEEDSRQHVANAYLGNRRSLCRVLASYKFFVPTGDQSVAPHLIMEGFWEAWITLAVIRTCRDRQGAVAVNVGANLGYYSVLLADCVGPEGRLIGFEPQPALAAIASDNLRINGMHWGVIANMAAGDGSTSSVYLNTVDDLMGSAFVSSEPGGATEVLSVPCVAVDDRTERCDILLVDAEGYEPQVLRGAERALSRSDDPLVFIEYSPGSYADPQGFFNEMASKWTVSRVDFSGGHSTVSFSDLDTAQWSTLMLRRK